MTFHRRTTWKFFCCFMSSQDHMYIGFTKLVLSNCGLEQYYKPLQDTGTLFGKSDISSKLMCLVMQPCVVIVVIDSRGVTIHSTVTYHNIYHSFLIKNISLLKLVKDTSGSWHAHFNQKEMEYFCIKTVNVNNW